MNDRKIKVSIIVPTYNVQQYLVECMNSIIHQTLREIEVICINDGSTDNSLNILKSYAENDDRIIIVDKENGGYGIGMNIGQDMARGEYIGIVEPDDFININMYEKLYTLAKKNDLDFIKADFYRFTKNDTNEYNLTYNHLTKKTEDYNKVFNPSEDPERLRYIMNTWSGIYKREFLEKYNIRYNETPGASFQDNGFWFQTFCFAQRAMIVNEPFYMNRRDNPNSSVKNPGKVYCMNIEYDHIREILMNDSKLWEKFKYHYTLRKFHNYSSTLLRISDEFREEYAQRFGAEMKRARDKSELRMDVFSVEERYKIRLLSSDSHKYLLQFVANTEREAEIQKELIRHRKLYTEQKKKCDKTEEQLTEYEQKYKELDEKCRKLRKKEKELKKIKEEYAQFEQQINDLKKIEKNLKKNEISYREKIAACEEEIGYLRLVQSSTTYKVGKLIMFIPCRVKDFFISLKRN